MTTILLDNDDGIRSIGLLAAKRALLHIGRVLVVAPKHQRSGIGKAITVRRPVRLERTKLADGSKAYSVSGTPADAYLLATEVLHYKPDVLVSGINLGPNLGIDDLLNSGTIGAAMEAAIHGVPAIAISLCINQDQQRRKRLSEDDMRLAKKVLSAAVRYVIDKGLPRDAQLISINVPFSNSIGGVSSVRPSMRGYKDIFIHRGNSYETVDWGLDIYGDAIEGTDVHAVKLRNHISIVPLKLGLSSSSRNGRGLAKHVELVLRHENRQGG